MIIKERRPLPQRLLSRKGVKNSSTSTSAFSLITKKHIKQWCIWWSLCRKPHCRLGVFERDETAVGGRPQTSNTWRGCRQGWLATMVEHPRCGLMI